MGILAAMKSRRTVAVAATVAMVAAAGGAAIAASTNDTESAILNDAAKRLNVTPKALEDALTAARDAQLDKAVEEGRLTQEQADRLKQERARSGSVLGGVGGGPGWHHGPGGWGHGGPGLFGRDELAAAAKALGLSSDELIEQLRDGKSLAEVAEAENKQLADVKAAVRAALAADLDQAVQDNRLTRERADEILEVFDERFDAFAQRSGPVLRGRHHGGPGFAFGGLRFDLRQEARAAAQALGLTRRELVDRLRDGDTLADIAKAEGKDLADVEAAVRKAFKAGLDAAVADGKITRARADEVLETFDDTFDELARRELPVFGLRGFRGP
jgi:hypothetical protein